MVATTSAPRRDRTNARVRTPGGDRVGEQVGGLPQRGAADRRRGVAVDPSVPVAAAAAAAPRARRSPPPRGDASSVTAGHRQPGQPAGRDGAAVAGPSPRRSTKTGAGAVRGVAMPAQPPQHVRHVRAEDAPVGVALVDHDDSAAGAGRRTTARGRAGCRGAACRGWSARTGCADYNPGMSRYGSVAYAMGPGPISQAVKVLIAVNVAAYLLSLIVPAMVVRLGLVPAAVVEDLTLWQPLTYMFLHGGLGHLLFNMLALWMFGTELERTWGTRFFLRYYLVTGVGAALVTIAWTLGPLPYADSLYHSVVIGASGAIYGLLLAYGLYFPSRTIYLYFLFPDSGALLSCCWSAPSRSCRQSAAPAAASRTWRTLAACSSATCISRAGEVPSTSSSTAG